VADTPDTRAPELRLRADTTFVSPRDGFPIGTPPPACFATDSQQTTTMKLRDKRILITGGGSGIGLELARRLADGNRVVIAGRDEAKLERAQSLDHTLLTRRVDITSEESVAGVVAWLYTELDGLDLLVNNAGVMLGGPLTSARGAEKTAVEVEVNVAGTIRMTRLALPLLQASDASGVLFMSSAVALAAVPGFAVYAATKAAIHSLARSLRVELEPHGVRVFEALPPVVDTNLAHALDVPKISPAEVADAVIAGLQDDRAEIRIGSVRGLALLARLAPAVADRLVTHAIRPSGAR
jgi:uncharacterized oxidoreductase